MYFVFNLDQTTLSPSQTMDINFQKVKSAQEIIDNFLESDRPKVEIGINPSYHPINDIVKMPPMSDFYTEEEYFSTFFHELIHSTGHKSRLNRS